MGLHPLAINSEDAPVGDVHDDEYDGVEEDDAAVVTNSPSSSLVERLIPRMSWPRLLVLNLGMLGLQFGWAFEYAFMTPTLTSLGLSTTLASYAWMFSPLIGV